MKLLNKAVVVTGASSGMGREIVKQFALEGANVIAVARRKEKLDDLVNECSNYPGKIIAFQGDVSKKNDNEDMIDACVKEFGKMDILVCNAGVMDDMATVENFSDQRYEYVMGINLYGPMAAIRKAIPVFKTQGGGNIIVTSSVGGSHQAAGAVYCASKAAVDSLVRNTAFSYRYENIRCNAIAPGGIETDIATSMGNVNIDGATRFRAVQSLMPGMGKGLDIANAALFLASDESKFISGQILAVDGGWTSF